MGRTIRFDGEDLKATRERQRAARRDAQMASRNRTDKVWSPERDAYDDELSAFVAKYAR